MDSCRRSYSLEIFIRACVDEIIRIGILNIVRLVFHFHHFRTVTFLFRVGLRWVASLANLPINYIFTGNLNLGEVSVVSN